MPKLMLTMTVATIRISAPKSWDDDKCQIVADKVDRLIEKLEDAMFNGLKEIDPDLTGYIE